jgi:hypothetical protein
MRVSYVQNGMLCDVIDSNLKRFFLANEDSSQLTGNKQLFEAPCLITPYVSDSQITSVDKTSRNLPTTLLEI